MKFHCNCGDPLYLGEVNAIVLVRQGLHVLMAEQFLYDRPIKVPGVVFTIASNAVNVLLGIKFTHKHVVLENADDDMRLHRLR